MKKGERGERFWSFRFSGAKHEESPRKESSRAWRERVTNGVIASIATQFQTKRLYGSKEKGLIV